MSMLWIIQQRMKILLLTWNPIRLLELASVRIRSLVLKLSCQGVVMTRSLGMSVQIFLMAAAEMTRLQVVLVMTSSLVALELISSMVVLVLTALNMRG